jgi:hypothetical protein
MDRSHTRQKLEEIPPRSQMRSDPALGLPRVFTSMDEDNTIDNAVAVAGYVVMRVSMIFLWPVPRGRIRLGLPDLCAHHRRRAVGWAR